jgi:hypothetical protein
MTTTNTAITDDQELVSASTRFGHPIPVYDDGYGPLWISRDSMGINGIVRASTWEDAYGICEDEFFPEASETIEEIKAEYGFVREHVKVIRDAQGVEREALLTDYPFSETGCTFVRWETRETPDADAWPENELFHEAFGFRPNGPNVRDTHKHGIYAKDLNGDYLDLLTDELATELGLTLVIAER